MIHRILVLSSFILLFGGGLYAQGSKDISDAELREKIAKIRAELKQGKLGKRAEARRAAAREKSTLEGDSFLSLGLQLGGGLVGILVLAVFSIKGLKKLQSSSMPWNKKGKQGCLEILDTCYLGKDQKIAAIRINHQLMVLGATPRNIQLIAQWPDVPPNFEEKVNRETASQSELAKSLNDYLVRFKKQKPVSHQASRA